MLQKESELLPKLATNLGVTDMILVFETCRIQVPKEVWGKLGYVRWGWISCEWPESMTHEAVRVKLMMQEVQETQVPRMWTVTATGSEPRERPYGYTQQGHRSWAAQALWNSAHTTLAL